MIQHRKDNFVSVLVLMATMCCALLAQAKSTWNVPSGEYSDKTSWKSGALPNGEQGEFSDIGDTVTTFTNGATETSYTLVMAATGETPRTVVFDTMNGGWWRKLGYSAAGGVLRFAGPGGTEVCFDLQGASKTVLDVPRFYFSGGLIRYEASSVSGRLEFEGGDFNAYDPESAVVTAADRPTLLTGTSLTYPFQMVVGYGARLKLRAWQHYSNAAGSKIRLEGGTTEVVEDFAIRGNAATANDTEALVEVCGGTLNVGGNLQLSKTSATVPFAKSVLVVTNDAKVSVAGALDVATGCNTNGAIVRLGGAAELTIGKFCANMQSTTAGAGTTSLVEVAENAVMRFGDSFIVGRHLSGCQLISLKDGGCLEYREETTPLAQIGYNVTCTGCSTGLVELAGRATAGMYQTIVGSADEAGKYPAFGRICVRDSAHWTSDNYLYVGSRAKGVGEVVIEDEGAVEVKGAFLLGRGTGTGVIRLNGGSLRLSKHVQTTGSGMIIGNGGVYRPSAAGATIDAEISCRATSRGFRYDTNGFDMSLVCPIADADGEEGVFVKLGSGTLTATVESEHAITRVEGGILACAEGVTKYGKRLIVSGGTLDASATDLSVASLVLGEGDRSGVLVVDAGHPVRITATGGLQVRDGIVRISGGMAEGTVVVFETADALSDSDIENLRVVDGETGFSYAFSMEGGCVKLTKTAHAQSTVTWIGEEDGRWNRPENWDDAVPLADDHAVFPAGTERKQIELVGMGQVGSMEFSGGEYTLSGGRLVANGGLSVEVSSDCTGRVSSAIALYDGAFSKVGDGVLAVGGDNVHLNPSVITSGGTLLAESPTAIGRPDADGSLRIDGGTFAWNAAPTALVRNVVFGGSLPVAIRTDRALTFCGNTSFPVSGCALVKLGPDCLTFRYPTGTGSKLSRDAYGSGTVGEEVDYDGNGNIRSTSGYTSLNVFDGTLALEGAGSDRTTVIAYRNLAIGGRWNPQVSPVMRLKSIHYSHGAVDGNTTYKTMVGAYMTNSLTCPPSLELTDDVLFETGNLEVGYHGSREKGCCARLCITNSTLIARNSCFLPFTHLANDYCRAVVRIGSGGFLQVADGVVDRATGGLHVGTCDIRIENGGRMSAGPVLPLVYDDLNYGGGHVVVANGGRISATGLLGVNVSGPSGVTNVYDRGTLALTASGTSLFAHPKRNPTVVNDGGMSIDIPEGVVHRIAFPITGSGVVSKVGQGALLAGKVLDWEDDGNWKETGGVVFGNAGGLCIAEGSVDLGGGACDLGRVFGSGVVSNGSVRCVIDIPADGSTGAVLCFKDVAFDRVVVDFNRAEDSGYDLGVRIPVARLAQGLSADVSRWKARNCGTGRSARFSVEGDIVVAEICPPNGVILIVK